VTKEMLGVSRPWCIDCLLTCALEILLHMSQIFEHVLCRVFEQHALSKEEWQEKVVNWHMEHKGLMRLSIFHSL